MDINFLLFLQNLRLSWGESTLEFFRASSFTTDAEILLLLIGLIYWCISKNLGIYVMQSLVFSRLINGLLKISVCCYRPWVRDPLVKPADYDMSKATGYSFPSGHASNAVVFYGSLAFRKKVHIVWKILVSILIIIVCFSRMYLGVHTPQDIITGVVVGFVSIGLSYLTVKFIKNNPHRDIWVCIGGLIFCVILAIYALNKLYPVDYGPNGNMLVDPNNMIKDCFRNIGIGAGFFIGWILERRLVKFSTDVNIPNKIARFILCVGLYYAFYFLISFIFSNINLGVYTLGIKNFLVMFYVVFLAPLVIRFIDYCFTKWS